MSTESYIGQQFRVNRKSFTVERIIAEGEFPGQGGRCACVASVSRFLRGVRSRGFQSIAGLKEFCPSI